MFPTSNHNPCMPSRINDMLFISCFLHQTTTTAKVALFLNSCLYLVSYIKPQPTWWLSLNARVVYILFPTSNHNWHECRVYRVRLFISCFLHQTTTINLIKLSCQSCLYLVSYIKPQPPEVTCACSTSCLYLVSYIKPQQRPCISLIFNHLYENKNPRSS